MNNQQIAQRPKFSAMISTPGYQTYFLWLMAGDHQGFNRSSDPAHAWIEKK